MATMLRDNQSTRTHLNLVRRHMRLCSLHKDAGSLVSAIRPAFDELASKADATARKAEAREDALDLVILLDVDLDNGVRTTFEKCAQHDRENAGQSVLTTIFPEGKFSTITSASRTSEPDLVERLTVRLESLGEGHPIHGTAADLKKKIAASRQAIDALYFAVTEQKKAEAEEEIAQLKLRRQYELNYLDARRTLGKDVAERLFPRVSGRPTTEEPTDPQV